jgi:hypothetical protein
MTLAIPFHLADDELTREVGRLSRTEREMTAALVAHLAEFDARRLYLGAGYPSLFAYCTKVLHLSEHGTYNRIEAGRAARQFPVILEMLHDGSLNLAILRVLAPHLTRDNHGELLAGARHRSKRDVEALVAGLCPRPDVPALVRKLPVPGISAPSTRIAPRLAGPGVPALCPERPAPESVAVGDTRRPESRRPYPPVPPSMSVRPTITVLAPERYQVRFTASAGTYRKLREAQELLGHAIPTGDVAEVVDRALTALLADLKRRKLAATNRPQAARSPTTGSRRIPAAVRRTVWNRDGGQCAFMAKTGLRCSARKPLEFHHVHPYGAGGEATVDNIELRCRGHNAYESDLFYGWREGGGAGVSSPRGEFGGRRSLPPPQAP